MTNPHNPHDQPNHPDAVAYLERHWETAWWDGGVGIPRAMIELVDDRPCIPHTIARWPHPFYVDRLPNTSRLDVVISTTSQPFGESA